jgi:DNA-binding transcriptional regulator YhcF (GntR family)
MLTAFRLDLSSSVALEEQLVEQLITFQEVGLLLHAHQLPTVRELSVQLNVAPTVIETAYRNWQQRGLLQLLAYPVMQAQEAGYSKDEIRAAVEKLLAD